MNAQVHKPPEPFNFMSWSFWLICIPTVCYAVAAVSYGIQKNWPMVVVYSGYAWANTGLLALDRVMAK